MSPDKIAGGDLRTESRTEEENALIDGVSSALAKFEEAYRCLKTHNDKHPGPFNKRSLQWSLEQANLNKELREAKNLLAESVVEAKESGIEDPIGEARSRAGEGENPSYEKSIYEEIERACNIAKRKNNKSRDGGESTDSTEKEEEEAESETAGADEVAEGTGESENETETSETEDDFDTDEAVARLEKVIEGLPDVAKELVKHCLEIKKREDERIERRYGDQKKWWHRAKKMLNETWGGRFVGGAIKIGQGLAETNAAVLLSGPTGLILSPALFAHGTAAEINGAIQMATSFLEIGFDKKINEINNNIEKLTVELKQALESLGENDDLSFNQILEISEKIRQKEAERLNAQAEKFSLRSKMNLMGLAGGVLGATGRVLARGLPTGFQNFGGADFLSAGHNTSFDLLKGWMFSYKENEVQIARDAGVTIKNIGLSGAAGHGMGSGAALVTKFSLVSGLALAGAAIYLQTRYDKKVIQEFKDEAEKLKNESKKITGDEEENDEGKEVIKPSADESGESTEASRVEEVDSEKLKEKVRALGGNTSEIISEEKRNKLNELEKKKTKDGISDEEWNELMSLRTEANQLLKKWIEEQEAEKGKEESRKEDTPKKVENGKLGDDSEEERIEQERTELVGSDKVVKIEELLRGGYKCKIGKYDRKLVLKNPPEEGIVAGKKVKIKITDTRLNNFIIIADFLEFAEEEEKDKDETLKEKPEDTPPSIDTAKLTKEQELRELIGSNQTIRIDSVSGRHYFAEVAGPTRLIKISNPPEGGIAVGKEIEILVKSVSGESNGIVGAEFIKFAGEEKDKEGGAVEEELDKKKDKKLAGEEGTENPEEVKLRKFREEAKKALHSGAVWVWARRYDDKYENELLPVTNSSGTEEKIEIKSGDYIYFDKITKVNRKEYIRFRMLGKDEEGDELLADPNDFLRILNPDFIARISTRAGKEAARRILIEEYKKIIDTTPEIGGVSPRLGAKEKVPEEPSETEKPPEENWPVIENPPKVEEILPTELSPTKVEPPKEDPPPPAVGGTPTVDDSLPAGTLAETEEYPPAELPPTKVEPPADSPSAEDAPPVTSSPTAEPEKKPRKEEPSREVIRSVDQLKIGDEIIVSNKALRSRGITLAASGELKEFQQDIGTGSRFIFRGEAPENMGNGIFIIENKGKEFIAFADDITDNFEIEKRSEDSRSESSLEDAGANDGDESSADAEPLAVKAVEPPEPKVETPGVLTDDVGGGEEEIGEGVNPTEQKVDRYEFAYEEDEEGGERKNIVIEPGQVWRAQPFIEGDNEPDEFTIEEIKLANKPDGTKELVVKFVDDDEIRSPIDQWAIIFKELELVPKSNADIVDGAEESINK